MNYAWRRCGLTLLCLSLACQTALSETIASFEFTAGSLAPTLSSFASSNGISVGNLSTFTPPATTIADLASDPDALRLPGHLTANLTATAISGGQYLSFSVTIPSGVSIDLLELSADIGGTNTFGSSTTRLYSSLQGTPATFDVIADTIGSDFNAHLNGNSNDTPVTHQVINLANPALNTKNGVNVGAGAFAELSDTTVTFYLPWIDESSSDTRWATMDNLALIGAFTGASELAVTVNRENGEITLSNPGTIGGQDFIGYELLSPSASLIAANWSSIADTYDVNGSSATQISADDWTKLTGGSPEAPKYGDFSEFDFESMAGATLPASSSVSLGVGAWIPTNVEDLTFTYALPDGTEVQGVVAYIGNDGLPFAEGDINTDGDINAQDWMQFRTNLGGTFAFDSAAESYRRGDFDGDFDVDAGDFLLFRNLFEDANPGVSFAAMVASSNQVPEPAALVLVLIGAMTTIVLSPGGRRWCLKLASFVGCPMLVALTFSPAMAQVETFDGFAIGTAYSGGSVTGTTGAQLTSAGWTFYDYAAEGGTITDTVWTIEDETSAGGSSALAQTNTNPDFLTGGGNLPIAGGIAYTSQFDTSDPFMVYEWDFRFGGVALEGPGNEFADIKLLFGTVDELSYYSIDLVAGAPTTGASSQISISQTVPDGGDGQPRRLRPFNQLPALTTGLPENTPLRARVLHNSIDGEVSLSITDLVTSVVLAERSVVAPSFQMSGGSVGVGTNNDAFSFDRISAHALPRLTLQVDPVDGDTRIVNNAGSSIEIDLYQISSALGELDEIGWNSLEEQDLAGFPAGDGTGNGWEAGDASNNGLLIEAFLTGSSSFGNAATVYLGQSVAGNVTQTQNLEWRYHVAGSENSLVPGIIEFLSFDPPAGLPGDFNDDGVVNIADYTAWRDNLGSPDTVLPPGSTADGSGIVDADDYATWKNSFGSSNGSLITTAAVPEPSSLLVLLCGVLMASAHRLRLLRTAAVGICIAMIGYDCSAVELDRVYELGEEEGMTSGVVLTTYDGTSPFIDLSGFNGPSYVSVAERPGAAMLGNTTGIEFDGIDDYVVGFRFGNPETSRGAIGWDEVTSGLPDYETAKNYTNLSNRGLQLWVKPNAAGSGTVQSVIADTKQFGILISDDSQGNPTWLMNGGETIVDSGVDVAFDQWTHLALVRQFGTGSTLYINGIAATRTSSTYDDTDTARLVLGSNTEGDEITFSGGTTDFFRGILDQVELFTWGTSQTGPQGQLGKDFGTFHFPTDNGFASLPFAAGGLSGKAGDVNNDDVVDEDDIAAFRLGWRTSNLLSFGDGSSPPAPIADLYSHSRGDLNFDGRTTLSDAILLHQALIANGFAGLDLASLNDAAVPEPSTAMLALVAITLVVLKFRSSNCKRL